jgi:predicted CoA-substrate-specific enzyme activase
VREIRKAYLGIDVGSISTNLVLLDENEKVMAKRYLPTAGKPIEAVKTGLAEIWQEVGDQVEVTGVGTTGSGRYMIGELVGADVIKNEITAQATAAIAIDRKVDTIFEIGGQDSKFISVENGSVVDFTMNKVCAAGTGSFLEEQAQKLGINIKEEFADLALNAKSPASLGDRCTVFIESELNNHLQKGSSKADLAAGLAVSIVKNYLNKVVESRRVGDNIFFQGGVAFNQSVVNAFKDVTGKEIRVPPHHEVTGAIGIALIAMKEKPPGKSKFKGFKTSRAKYQTKTFECKSCENLCEINMVNFENEDPVFYGGRCEKWDNKSQKPNNISRGSKINLLPDLFKERDEIIFAQKPVKGAKKIGIPRVLFFYERFPFWNTFFTHLGFEVLLSSPSNPKIIHDSQENTATEACFPVTLAHGHILDLVKQNPDYIFIPSLINMEKASLDFTESFNCPFVQALPYFARAGIDFNSKTKLLTPALEPQRGKKYFEKQLVRLARSLGKGRKEAVLAARKAEKESAKIKKKLKDRGRQILELIKRENTLALAIISRPYNGSDQALNLGIPKKLKSMGFLAIPMDYLPVKRSEIAPHHPNMFWNYGQKILAAAKFVNESSSLFAVHITNFRCGPDSFISHFIKETIKSKPYLQIEVDEHASDTGIITRLEAFLDSLKNAIISEGRTQIAEHRAQSTGIKKRTIYIPRMSDHALALAAAIRACKVDAQALPPSDDKTLELGRKYTSGKECHPFIVTAGDFLRKIKEPGFDPQCSAFFMASASGPCRFGNYHKTHRMILDRIGYQDVPLVTPDAKDSYSKSMGLNLAFRRFAWQGIVAVDLLTKLTLETRPDEKNKGETDALHKFYLERICQAVEAGNGKIFALMRDIQQAYSTLELNPNGHKPVIGIVGEIFLRCNHECNADIMRRIEALGGKAWFAPISEWFYYTNLGYLYESMMRKLPHFFAIALARDLVQKWDERRLEHCFKGKIKNLKEPSTLKVLKYASPYLHYTFKGEAILSIGKAVDFIKKGASGIVNVMPFTCMPGTVVSALSKKLRQDFNDIPWLDLAIDGNEGVNLDTRLEAFMHQAKNRLNENFT